MNLKILQLAKRVWLNINSPHTAEAKPGFSLIEALLAISVFSVLIGILVGGPLFGEEAMIVSSLRGHAINLAEEGLEVVRNLRDENYANLAPGSYGLSGEGGRWQFTQTPDVTGVFTRQIQIVNISNSTTEVISTVNWNWKHYQNNSVILSTYLTNWR
jgi:prepilin-type N-terminal cleavage/methylation domain-containing protein